MISVSLSTLFVAEREGKLMRSMKAFLYIFLYLVLLDISIIAATSNNPAVERTKQWLKGSTQVKEKRRAALLKKILKDPVPRTFVPDQDSPVTHNKNTPNAIFTVGMSVNFMRNIAIMFSKTARDAGFTGDIVVAVTPGSRDGFMKVLRATDCVIYTTPLYCNDGNDNNRRCSIEEGNDDKIAIAMLRYYMYNWWARQYSSDTEIMIADFKDVFFQSNPFDYKRYQWANPVSQFTAFLEHHPNKVIGRCPHNSMWISNCYGKNGFEAIESETVSCSGVSIATQEGLLVYTYLMLQQLDISTRYIYEETVPKTASQEKCLSLGMDQGFHNFLLYSGQLERYMNVKIFHQGEGPVNTVGAFSGKQSLVKMSLKDWGIAKAEKNSELISIYNWNGDKSPVVHQFDRYLNSKEYNSGSYSNILVVGEKAEKSML